MTVDEGCKCAKATLTWLNAMLEVADELPWWYRWYYCWHIRYVAKWTIPLLCYIKGMRDEIESKTAEQQSEAPPAGQ